MKTKDGQSVAARIAAVLTALHELEKVSPADCDLIWSQIVAHVRSARPQALLSLQDVP